MTNPYIQNFINLRQQESNIPVAQNEIQKESSKINIKPYSPKGYIVKENPLQSAGSSVSGLAKTGVYFVNAMNGKGTDYTVGRINDGARFLGSLGIAAALASTAKNPKAKMMEFVGFATWFASMSLWPKMLGTAIKATKGVDINQEYVDSYGRRKGFFEDAQYITWDLYNDKDLYKMGDKLGVPKNIENRKDAIKEKAKQVATQGNTLMMLTAGFATPVATALICNSLENPVSKAIETYQIRKAEKGLKKLSENILMPGSEKGLEELGKIIGIGETVNLDVEKSRQVRSLFKQFEGTGIGDGVEKELNAFVSPSIKLDQKAKDGFREAVSLDKETIASTVFKRKPKSSASQKRVDAIASKIQKTLTINSEEFNGYFKHLENINLSADGTEVLGIVSGRVKHKLMGSNKTIYNRRKELVRALSEEVDKKVLSEVPRHASISVPRKVLENLFTTAHDFTVRKNIVDNYAKATIANVADSQTANHWENAPIKILEALGIDKNTRKLIANDPIKASEYLEQHLRELAKPENEEKLKEVVAKTAKITEEVVSKERKSAAKLIKEWRKVGRTIKKSAEGYTAFDIARKDAVRLEITNIQNKVMNTKNSFYRPLLVLERIKEGKASKEVIKELISGFGIDFWSNKGEHRGVRSTKKFGQFVEEAFAPIKKILGGKEGLGASINKFYRKIKAPLSKIGGGNNRFYPEIGKVNSSLLTNNSFGDNVIKNGSDWAVRVGKSFNDFIRDAATAKGIKSTWLKRVLFVAVPVVGVSLLAISQFGKKNNYNPDVYAVKGKQNGSK